MFTDIHRFLLRTVASAGVLTIEDADRIVKNQSGR